VRPGIGSYWEVFPDDRPPENASEEGRVTPERFDTELAAVWSAANFYNKASYQHLAEYIGVVFRENYTRMKRNSEPARAGISRSRRRMPD